MNEILVENFQKKKLKKTSNALESEVNKSQELRDDSVFLQTEIKNLLIKNRKNTEKLAEVRKTNDDLLDKIQNLTKLRFKAKNKLSLLQDKIQTLDDENKYIQAQKEVILAEIFQFDQSTKKVEAIVKDKRSIIDALKNEETEERKELERIKNSYSIQRTLLKKVEHDAELLAQKRKNCLLEISRLNSSIEEMGLQIENHHKQMAELQKLSKQTDIEKQEKNKQIQKLEKEISLLRAKIEDFKSKVFSKDDQSGVIESEKKYQKLTAEFEKLREIELVLSLTFEDVFREDKVIKQKVASSEEKILQLQRKLVKQNKKLKEQQDLLVALKSTLKGNTLMILSISEYIDKSSSVIILNNSLLEKISLELETPPMVPGIEV